MGTTANILTGLGTDRLVYKQIGNDLGIVVGPRTVPRIITPGLSGYRLGLYDKAFVDQNITAYSGVSTYYVRIVPFYDGVVDTSGDYLTGIPTAQSLDKGISFSFLPMNEEYPCSGYQVWAGTVSGTLYYQGVLEGRFNTTFTIGTTWTYNSSGATLSPKTDVIPQFTNSIELYQSEGAVSLRTFLGGGVAYQDGYARVAQSDVATSLSGGTSSDGTYTNWTSITDGSFRLKLGWKMEDAYAQTLLYSGYRYWQSITGLDFSSATSMNDVASLMQTALQAYRSPVLYSGTSADQTITNWTSITDGSFEVFIKGTSYKITGLDFSSVTDMNDVAAVIQAGIRTATGGSVETCVWDSTAERFVINPNIPTPTNVIDNGDFSSAVGWTLYGGGISVNIGSDVATFTAYSGTSGVGSLRQIDKATAGKRYLIRFTYDATGITFGGATLDIYAGFVKDSVSPPTTYYLKTLTSASDLTGEIYAVLVCQSTYDNDPGVYCSAPLQVVGNFIVDNYSALELAEDATLSYLIRETTGAGTDISEMIDARGDSINAVLDGIGKPSTSETIVWDTDHFVITSQDAGDEYRIGFLESAPVGTDISGSAHMDCDSSGNGTVTWGETALRTVVGLGTSWGEWANGMRFRIASEAAKYLVGYQLEPDVLHLDSDYVGDGFNGFQDYVIDPYDDQVYISELSDPFTFLSENTFKLPTSDGDSITAIKRVGFNVAIFMKHHIWVLNSTDITAPRLVSNQYGAPNDACIVELDSGLAFYSGEDFMVLSGGRVRSLDPEGRMRALLSRISQYTPSPHGVFLNDERGDVVKWFFGIDDSIRYNVAICMDPKRGNWWIENHKDAYCSAVIRDSADKAHIVTGSEYDAAHAIPAFTMLHSPSFKADAASITSHATRHGTIATAGVGVATETEGYLTCGTSGAIAAFQAVTAGGFGVTIDTLEYDVGPLDLSGAADFDAVAAIMQAALRVLSGGLETIAYDTDHFVITSGTLTNQSNVSYLRPYLSTVSDTDLGDESYMTGREDQSTRTLAVSMVVLTLLAANGASAALETSEDGEKGCFLYVCNTQLLYGQYARVVSNTVDTVTVTPAFDTDPAAGWYWYMGAIVPSWTKWMDYGSPQHKQKLHGVAISVAPGEDDEMNFLGIHEMQDLSATIRMTEVQQLGGSNDTVNTVHMKDKEATQHGLRIFRPSSTHDLKIEDITVTHAPRV